MSVHLHFYNIIIPIKNLSKNNKLKNLKNTLRTYYKRNRKNLWYDEYLFTIGGIMSPIDVENEVKYLNELGLNPFKKLNGEQYWDDFCVTDFTGGPTLPCSWLACHIDPYNSSYAWLKNTKPGEIVKLNKERKITKYSLLNRIKNILRL